jgi:hypothetical protein
MAQTVFRTGQRVRTSYRCAVGGRDKEAFEPVTDETRLEVVCS